VQMYEFPPPDLDPTTPSLYIFLNQTEEWRRSKPSYPEIVNLRRGLEIQGRFKLLPVSLSQQRVDLQIHHTLCACVRVSCFVCACFVCVCVRARTLVHACVQVPARQPRSHEKINSLLLTANEIGCIRNGLTHFPPPHLLQ
jgi:hypothetical protein